MNKKFCIESVDNEEDKQLSFLKEIFDGFLYGYFVYIGIANVICKSLTKDNLFVYLSKTLPIKLNIKPNVNTIHSWNINRLILLYSIILFVIVMAIFLILILVKSSIDLSTNYLKRSNIVMFLLTTISIVFLLMTISHIISNNLITKVEIRRIVLFSIVLILSVSYFFKKIVKLMKQKENTEGKVLANLFVPTLIGLFLSF